MTEIVYKTILLIEDDLGIRDALAYALHGEGYTVVEAKNGQEGIDFLNNHPPPDLIILDLKMPVKDGEQFISEIKVNLLFKDIPVFVMSANIHQFSNPSGVNGLFQKPIDLENFLQAVSNSFANPNL